LDLSLKVTDKIIHFALMCPIQEMAESGRAVRLVGRPGRERLEELPVSDRYHSGVCPGP
jgi:hypothetical protein